MSSTLAVAHHERNVAVLDLIREVRPPFSPEAVVKDFSETLRLFRVHRVAGDAYAGSWPSEEFSKAGINYRISKRSKSDIYRQLLPLLNSGRIRLLDQPRLVGQLLSLERRTARGGRDSVDHGPRGHDDIVNAAAGVLVEAASRDLDDLGITF